MAREKDNPGLQAYDLSSYTGLRGKNFYKVDRTIQRIVERYSEGYTPEHKKAMISHLEGYGELVGGKLDELTEACHKEGKYGEIEHYDRTGKRIDAIRYSPEQLESRKLSYEYGIVNLDFHTSWKHPFTFLHRYALTYLNNLNGEGGVACPLAMTEGMIFALKEIGTEAQKKKYLPLVAGEKSSSHFMAGQYVTERVGGSNVQANRTVAKKLENGKWLLNGEKWFCSNPGDLWVTTARVEGTNTIGLFLVPRLKDNGELNGHHILRKKDIIGSRGKVTTEIVYEDLEAEELGRTTHGLANLVKYVISISRIHVAVGACGNAKRAVMEAAEYARFRTAYGKKIQDFSAYTKQLSEIAVLQAAMAFSVFRFFSYVDKGIEAEAILAPLLKYKSSLQASHVTREAMICLGGNGIIGDFSPVPRLHNDSIINETWEGTHLIITGHFLQAMNRKRKYTSFLNEIENNVDKAREIPFLHYPCSTFETKLVELKDLMEEPKDWKEANRTYLAELAYEVFALSELLEQAAFDNKADSVYTDLAHAFAEICAFGLVGKRKRNSIFLNHEKMQRIIEL